MTKAPYSIEFSRVAWVDRDHLVLCGHLPAFPQARVTRVVEYRNGQWSQLADLPEVVASLGVSMSGRSPTVHALLRNGMLHQWTGGQHRVDIIGESRRLFFSELREIDGARFACGAGHQVLRRGIQSWEPLDSEIFIDPSASRAQARLAARSILTSIDGTRADDVYAVGSGGVIFHFDGTHWHRMDSPTHVGLMRVRCVADRVVVCGYHGLVLEGGRGGWRVVRHQHGSAPLIDIATLGSRVFISSEFSLFELIGDQLVEAELPAKGAPAFGSLAGDGHTAVVSAGGEDIFVFDGGRWSRLPCPWNAESKA